MGLGHVDARGSEFGTVLERGSSDETFMVTSMAVRVSHHLEFSRRWSLATQYLAFLSTGWTGSVDLRDLTGHFIRIV